MFKPGDKVHIKSKYKHQLFTRSATRVGTVIGVQRTKEKQWCRVRFSKSVYDYDDLGSWKLQLIK